MYRTGVQAVFVLLLLFEATVTAQKGAVTFWRDKVTLTCPGSGSWTDHEKQIDSHQNETLEFEYKGQAQYSCEYKTDEGFTEKYHFYVKGKACPNCFEVDGFLFMLVIIVDVIGTSILMIIIYSCCSKKKKSPDVPVPPPRSPVRSRRHGPSPQASAYESLNPNTLSVETYSTVLHRTG